MANPIIKPYEQQIKSSTGEGTLRPHAVPVADAFTSGLTGRGLALASKAVGDVAEMVERRREEQARAWSVDAIATAKLDWTQRLTNAMDKMDPATDHDFTGRMIKEYQDYTKEILKNAPTNRAGMYLNAHLTEFGTQIGARAMTFEAKARADYRTDSLSTSADKYAKLMNDDPTQYQTVVDDWRKQVEFSDIPPINKSALLQKGTDRITSAAVWSQIQKSPTAFLQSIGWDGTSGAPGDPKLRKSAVDLKAETGNAAFDALPFEKRVGFFESAVRLKAQIDTDGLRGAENNRTILEREAMKEADARLYSPGGSKLTANFVEKIRPVLGDNNYRYLLKALKSGPEQKNDVEALIDIERLIYAAPGEAIQKANQYFRNGLLGDETFRSTITKAQELIAKQGPKSEYERGRQYITNSMDPGPLIKDPVGKQRMADALDTFDRWIMGGKRTDEEINKRSKEVVDQFKFISFNDSVIQLPQPRGSMITRQTADPAKMNNEIVSAVRKLQQMRDAGQLTPQEYNAEMTTVDRWRHARERFGGK